MSLPSIYQAGSRHWVLPAGEGSDRQDAVEIDLPALTDERIRAAARLALHDAICVDAADCGLREAHSQGSLYYIQWSSIADAMIRLLGGQP